MTSQHREEDKLIRFFDEIQKVCKAYNMSISHEDCHGGFHIQNYNEDNIAWLRDASDMRDDKWD